MARAPVMLWLAVFALIISSPQACRAEDEEAVVYKKPLSEWLGTLKSDKVEKNRRAALIAVGEVGLRSRKVVPAVAAPLRQDESATVRQAAAQLLGPLAFKATDLLPGATCAVRLAMIQHRNQALEAP